MILKICGITNQEDADTAVEGGANAIGFNFYPRSPRYIKPERAAGIRTRSGVRRVGVFVNEPRGRVEEIAAIAALDTVQLHGDETDADYPVGLPVWKAVRVSPDFDVLRFAGSPAEALVLDGPAAELYGGAGKTFEWGLVGQASRPAQSKPQGLPHIIVAGGLDASNVAQAVSVAHPWGLDACSRIESIPGKKDLGKMRAFLEAAKAALGVGGAGLQPTLGRPGGPPRTKKDHLR